MSQNLEGRLYEKLLKQGGMPPGYPISFGKTLTPLLEGRKTVTRRIWKGSSASRHTQRYNKGFPIQAFDHSRRKGGRRIGWLKLTLPPYEECLRDMPEEEVLLEGFPDMTKAEFLRKFFQGQEGAIVWVVRFKFVPINEQIIEQVS